MNGGYNIFVNMSRSIEGSIALARIESFLRKRDLYERKDETKKKKGNTRKNAQVSERILKQPVYL